MRKKLEVHLGEVFYELTVIDPSPIRKNRRAYVKCKCSCGNIKYLRKDYLLSKIESRRVKSCGCKKNENRAYKKRRPESMYSTLYRNCKSLAKDRGIEFHLLKEEHIELIKKDCYYCGSPPKLGQRVGKHKAMV